jgi:hypothetical protein
MLIYYIFDCKFSDLYDPCPVRGVEGLDHDWNHHSFIYCNPPSPSRPWAEKAIASKSPILYMCFSEAVLWQVPQLKTYPVLFFQKRISFIDSRTMQPADSPSNYNALVLINANDHMLYRMEMISKQYGHLMSGAKIYN